MPCTDDTAGTRRARAAMSPWRSACTRCVCTTSGRKCSISRELEDHGRVDVTACGLHCHVDTLESQGVHEATAVAHLHHAHAHIDRARRERREQCEEMPLGTADPLHPLDVEHPHDQGRVIAGEVLDGPPMLAHGLNQSALPATAKQEAVAPCRFSQPTRK